MNAFTTSLEEMLPGSADIRATFAAADLQLVASQILTQTVAPDWTVYAEKLAVGVDSALARLSPHDFEDGLAAVRRHAAAGGRGPVVEAIDLFVFRSE